MRSKAVIAARLVGAALAAFAGLQAVGAQQWYSYLLAVGLYASTYNIDLKDARSLWRIVVQAVTLGVVVKAAIIGSVMSLIFQDPFWFEMGMSFAQIDPLSVAALEGKSQMSKTAKTLLRAWSSFDDPVTVLLVLYVPYMLNWLFGGHAFATLSANVISLAEYTTNLGLNVVFAAVAFYVWRLVRLTRWSQRTLVAVLFVGVVLFVGAHWLWMFGVALVGLDIRPTALERVLTETVRVAFLLVVILLVAMWYPQFSLSSLFTGMLLGVVSYAAQVPVAAWLTRKLPRRDRIYLMLAQQNGITAIILALLLELVRPGVVAVVAPAIIMVNVLHAICNAMADRRLSGGATQA